MKTLRLFLTLLSYLGPLVFFGLLLIRFDASQIISFFAEADRLWLVTGGLLVPFSVILLAVSWKLLLLPNSPPFGRIFFGISQWALFEQILPFRMSEAIKVYYFGVEEKMGKTRTLSALFGEEIALGGAKIFFFAVVMAGGPIAGWLFWGIMGYTVIVAGLIISVGWGIQKITPPQALGENTPLKKKIRFHLHNWFYQMHALKNRKNLGLVILLLTLKIFVEVLVFWWVGHSFGIVLTLHQSGIVIAALYLTILFAITPGHYGVLEGVSMIALNSFGIPFDKGFTLSVSYHLVLSASFITIGLLTRLFCSAKNLVSPPCPLEAPAPDINPG